MKNGPLFLLGLFVSLLISWAGFVLGSHGQIGSLAPYYDDGDGASFPQRTTGLAARGQLVYADLGCAACHTQQVRRPDFGSDKARGWGDRQSVARDYIHQARPQPGASRFGPDLTNLAGRKPEAPTAEKLYALLYKGSAIHPAYGFLFEQSEISGERSALALPVSLTGALPRGEQVVPTERAVSLVAYLQSLKTSYDYPEAKPVEFPKKEAKK